MSTVIKLYLHPLSSFCWKVKIALYEADIPFEPVTVDLMDPAKRAEYLKLSPFGKIPTLVDGDRVVNETSIMIEYLAMKFPKAASLLPKNPAEALKVRARDRFYDLYVNAPLGKIATDRMRPEDKRDAAGIEAIMNDLRTAVSIVEKDMATQNGAARTWAADETFTMADCAAAPSLFYVNKLIPYAPGYPNVARYLDRLQKRPSVARAIEEAKPYFHMAPY